MMRLKCGGLMAVACALINLVGTAPAVRADVLTLGPVKLGLNKQAHLNDSVAGVGLAYAGVGDGIYPGCLCEGWGVSGSGVSGGASHDLSPGIFNYTVDSFLFGASTATLTGHLTSLAGVKITHDVSGAISSATGALFKMKVTVANMTGSTLTALKYQRVMDWDIPPTEFSEYVTHRGVVAGIADGVLEASHDNGFNSVNPLAGHAALNPATVNVNFEDNGPADHGSFFRFSFGSLADGASKEFNIFYGAAGTEAEADTFASALGLEIVSYGQQRGAPATGTPATFVFGFTGLGLPPVADVPEPTSLTLLALGAFGMAGYGWRRRKGIVASAS